MESTTVDSMCRCCAAEGLFKDIKTSYHWMGEEEVYGDMLRECFDVKLAMIEQGGICEVCITQLRNATNFKKQVQHTEKKFKRQLDSGRFKATEVKEEVSGEERAHSSDENDQDVDNDNVDDEDYMPDFEIPIKTESPEEKSRKRGAKASTSRAKRSRLADDADKNVLSSDDDDPPLSAAKSITLCRKVNFSCFISIPPEGVQWQASAKSSSRKRKPTAQKRKTAEVFEDKPPALEPKRKTITKRTTNNSRRKVVSEPRKVATAPKTRLTEMDWHFDNIRTILNCSNATPIQSKEDGGHTCSYCFQKVAKLTDLKKHCFNKHKNGKPDFLKQKPGRSLSKHIVFLDITALKCKLCRADIESLEMLMEHLQDAHEETMHLVIKNQIMPLRVVDEKLRCAVCAVEVDFDAVAEHMSQHYRNYVCEFCDASFVIRCKMLDHKKNVHDV